MSQITCTRCGRATDAVTNTAFYTGEVATALRAHACGDCWQEWIRMQIMIINEYRLNLMDPKTDDFLNTQVLAFFNLGPDGTQTAQVNFVPEEK